jgi:prevent-host-death family protein
MAKSYSIAEARERFSEVVDRAASGTPVRISRRGKPVAVLVSATWFESRERRRPTFWEAYQAFRKELELADIDLDPDEIWKDVRDKSPGRDFRF